MEFMINDSFWIIWAIIGLAALAFWLFALIDILKSNLKKSSERNIWVLVMLFMPFLGATLYFIIGRNNKV